MITVRTSEGEYTLSLDEFEASVRDGRIAPSTPVRFPVLTQDTWVEARDLELFRRLYSPARIYFTRRFSLGRFPILTGLLCVLQVALYLWTAGFERSVSLDELARAGAKWQPLVLELGQTWRLFVANVLHRDVLHLFFNLFFLFNLGGTVENAYRRRDYAFIVVASAVGTTGMSTFFSELPSVGASGIVLGLFGSASVFGYRYGTLLPKRYRRYFGSAVLPCAAFIVVVGLATKDTDNWGHLGGLFSGILATIPLRPALLWRDEESRNSAARFVSWRSVPLMGLVGLVLWVSVSGFVIRRIGPVYEVHEDVDSGIRIAYPQRWHPREDHLGLPSWGNPLGASVGVRAERRADGPHSVVEWLADFRETFLRERIAEGEIAEVRLGPTRPFLIEGGQGVEVPIDLESRAGPLFTRNLLVVRGNYRYLVVVAAPKAWAGAYDSILDEMLGRVTLTEPATLTRARARVRVFPGMSSARVELGDQLAAIGRAREAAIAYQQVLSSFEDHMGALYGLCKLALDYDGDPQSAERVATDLVRRRPEDSRYALLLADLRRRLGQTEAACAVVREALDRVQEPLGALRERLLELGCSSAVGFEP